MKNEKKTVESNCDTCEFYDYDEYTDEYCCMAKLDEDDMVRFLQGNTAECPFYQSNDEYKIVRKQM